jgi:hypothetical protein
MSQGVGMARARVGRGAAREAVASMTRRMFGRREGEGTREGGEGEGAGEGERERDSEGLSPAGVLSPTR